jgi:tetratricopeptide (TPR) repeat protein
MMLALEPKHDKVEYLMGLAYFETERYDEAGAWFTKGQGHSNRNPMNFVGGGAVAAYKKDYTKAKADLDKAVELNAKNDPKVFLAIANAWMSNPDKDKAKQQPFWKEAELYLYKVQKLAPTDAESYVLLGKLYGLQGVAELEQSMYEKAIELDPKYIYGYFRLGQLFKKQAKYQEAAEKFLKITEIDPGFGPVYLEMAEMWTLAKKYDKAEENMTKYLNLMGSDPYALVRKMIIEYLGDQFDKAIVTGLEALKDTNATVIKRIVGYSYVKKTPADAENGLKYLDMYFEATKNNPAAIIASDYENYGKVWQLKGDFVQAAKYYNMAIDKATEKGEPNNELLNVMSEMYKEQKDTTNRILYLRRYILAGTKYQLKENFALGQAYYQIKDYVHADSVFDVMTQKMPDLHIGWSWRGRCNSAMDPDSKQGKAIPYYQKVLDLLGPDPEKIVKYQADYVTALRYFGAYHTLVTEKFSEAIPFWQKILELIPADEGAKNGLEFCKQKGGK